jgi:hypothetical protein
MRRRILPRRGKPGGCVVRLTSAERALLARLPKELEEVLSAVASGGGGFDAGGEAGGGAGGEAGGEAGGGEAGGEAGGGEGGEAGGGGFDAGGEAGGGARGEGQWGTREETERTAFPPVEGIPVIPASLKRLFPPAYTGDDDAERSYVALARADLLAHHRRALQILSETAPAKSLDEEELQGWLTAINDVRLVLGTVLDIREDTEIPDEPVSPQLIAYYYLSGLQGEVVDFLAELLPEPVPGADDQIPDDPWGEPLGGLRWDGTPQPDSP